MNIHDFQKKKDQNIPISMVTCYDHWSAKLIEKTNIDCVLVGDSLAMVMHGYPTTLNATMDIMSLHIQAVSKGLKEKFLIGDLPFLSYRRGVPVAMDAIQQAMAAGSNAIKLEGAYGNLELIHHAVESGVPVMGHIGLTPQSIHQLGGFKLQGKEKKQADDLLNQARLLEEAGCFSIVLECVPSFLSKTITESLSIPTIGIGAGPYVSGQVLVLQDMLGMNEGFKPKFLRTYLNGSQLVKEALNQFDTDVKNKTFPNEQESY